MATRSIRPLPSSKLMEMEKKGWFGVLPVMEIFFLLCLFCMSQLSATVASQGVGGEQSMLKTYIVHVKKPEGLDLEQSKDLDSWYRSFLPDSSASLNGKQRLVYSYRHAISGFAARMTEEEVKAMEKKEGFVMATPEKIYKLHTTHSPSFLGLYLKSGFWRRSKWGEGVVIGVLDTGIHPSHPSFRDEGMPAPPDKWTGTCEFNWTVCNNKLIGARNFDSMSKGLPPSDEEGHGTHTASTAAGNFVKEASVFRNAKGTAVGIAPRAHLAIYKVCSPLGCGGSDLLAAMEAAIVDGVDVLSLSIGGPSSAFFDDPIALGAFAATRKGILVSCSAGNEGPDHFTTSNEAPWILTVGASTQDRSIVATAKLGSKEEFVGESLFQPKNFASNQWPLVYAGASDNQTSAFCAPGSLKGMDVKGKVVLCDRGGGVDRIAKGEEVKNEGGVAMIHANDKNSSFSTLADPHVLPATHVSYSAGLKIKTYINSTAKPTATITFGGTALGVISAPEVTSFSSRGPSLASPGILKPDIIGPGVSILAAWPTSVENKQTKSTFNMISGTSMSCPHLSGIAALIKSSHPDWSPAAIKSAIMTTADALNFKDEPILDEKHEIADFFAIGAGHVNPSKANDPGLVYDIQPNDYIPYLCGLGYKDEEVGIIALRPVNCSQVTSIPEAELNYPSFSVALSSESLKFKRTVTNVGKAKSSYAVRVSAPDGVDVKVNPPKLHFNKMYQKKTYAVTFRKVSSGETTRKTYAQGFIKWLSSTHSVKSPISVTFE